MASSSIAYPSATQQQSYYDEPTSPVSQPQFTPATPAREENEDVSFHRESAPEPETPAPPPLASTFSYSTYDTDPYTPASPLASIAPAVPLSPSEQTPFGSPPISSTFQSPSLSSSTSAFIDEPISPSRPTNKPDLSALLGEEKPTLPSFSKPKRKERSEGVAGPLGSKIAVLPVSSVGRKPVGGALAALLGLEVEEEEKKPEPAAKVEKKKETVKAEDQNVQEEPKEEAKKVEAEEQGSFDEATTVEDSNATEIGTSQAPLPPSEAPSSTEPVEQSAIETALPPSPPSEDLEPVEESNPAPSDPPILSRMPSEAPSTLSTATENIPYESMVSPLDTSVDENGERREAAWPANKQVEGLESQLASVSIDDREETAASSPSSTPTASFSSPPTTQPPETEPTTAPATSSADPTYSQYIFSDDTSNSQTAASSAPSRGFRAFNGSGDEGGFGGTDDGDSLRGAYSRSVEVGDAEENDTETGPSSPATERAVEREGSVRSQREVRSISLLFIGN
jgi:sorting nexin-1/2